MKPGPKTSSLNVRFWKHVNKNGPTPSHVSVIGSCWVWTGRTCKGYGRIHGYKNDGSRVDHQAQRASWILNRGEIPNGLCVLHKCDNPTCVNPDHLFLGTLKDNVEDMIRKGRKRFGVRFGPENNKTKLTEKQVSEIRGLPTDMPNKTVAARFGITPQNVLSIRCNRIWRHVKHDLEYLKHNPPFKKPNELEYKEWIIQESRKLGIAPRGLVTRMIRGKHPRPAIREHGKTNFVILKRPNA